MKSIILEIVASICIDHIHISVWCQVLLEFIDKFGDVFSDIEKQLEPVFYFSNDHINTFC